jgi:hypothetical protein
MLGLGCIGGLVEVIPRQAEPKATTRRRRGTTRALNRRGWMRGWSEPEQTGQ